MLHESAKLPPAGQPWQDRHSQAPRVSVRFLHQLNELQDGLLMAGAADGAVRVWRNYTVKGNHSLATAFQVGLQEQHDRDHQHWGPDQYSLCGPLVTVCSTLWGTCCLSEYLPL